MHNLNVLENARRQMRVHLYPVDKLTLRILHFHIMSCGWWWCCTYTCLPILYLCLYLTALSYSTSLAYMMSVYIQINSRTKQETARCCFFSLAVFSSKIFLSKLHYSSITSNLLPHVWSIKCR